MVVGAIDLDAWPALVAIAALAVVALAAVWAIPRRQARAWARQGIGGQELAELENNARATVVQVIGGVALILTFAATWAQLADTRRATDETLRLTAAQQRNERFTRATDQIASRQLEVRVGALTALGTIAGESASHREMIIQILLAYLHERHPEPGPGPELGVPILFGFGAPRCTGADLPSRTSAPDTQAALTVIGDQSHAGRPRDDLRRLDLRSVDARSADFRGVSFRQSILTEANLNRAQLGDADLSRADLTRACLKGASLEGAAGSSTSLALANLRGADLTGAQLSLSNLQKADLTDATLRSANLYNADLKNARLAGVSFDSVDISAADLTGTGVTREALRGAKTDECTRLPWRPRVSLRCSGPGGKA